MNKTIKYDPLISVNTFSVPHHTRKYRLWKEYPTLSSSNYIQIYSSNRIANQLLIKLFPFPPIFLKTDFYLLRMVTRFRTDEMLAMLGGFSHLVLLSPPITQFCCFWVYFLSFYSRSSVLHSARSCSPLKSLRILLTGCHCLTSFALYYLPVGA